ncbi:sulfatase family protein [Saccharicrinis sp. 156]|uniref:sulfatase family protein n=1 Tax=Saccharicrinis sp. 156 TaxID=3417574 RepID=UPI003D3564E6
MPIKLTSTNISALLVLCIISLNIGCTRERDDKPNIVFIMADDMGYGDVGSYNQDSKIQTANMDKLATEGLMFTHVHTPSSLCTPTRYGLLTGRYCWRTRLKEWVLADFYGDTPLIEEERMTIASMLKNEGYKTACIGKWHVGMTWNTKDGRPASYDEEDNVDFTKPVIGGPIERGFDYFFGTAGCSTSDPPYCFIENKKTISIPNVMIPEEMDARPGVVKGLMASDWSQEDVDVRLTEKAVDYIANHQTNHPDDPFFLYFVPSSPHIPWMVPDFMKGKTEEGARGDLVALVDWCVGQITEALEEYGLDDNTLIIVTSDNGPRKGANGHKSAGEFKGYKSQIWDGGHRVPFIAKWPGRIKPGTKSDEVFSLTDMMATFAALHDVELPANTAEDSYNVLPALLGGTTRENKMRPRVFHSGNGVFAIQQGDWKLIQGTKGSGSGKDRAHADSLLVVGQLYNLTNDPFERSDLWDKYPEKVIELNRLLEYIKN